MEGFLLLYQQNYQILLEKFWCRMQV